MARTKRVSKLSGDNDRARKILSYTGKKKGIQSLRDLNGDDFLRSAGASGDGGVSIKHPGILHDDRLRGTRQLRYIRSNRRPRLGKTKHQVL